MRRRNKKKGVSLVGIIFLFICIALLFIGVNRLTAENVTYAENIADDSSNIMSPKSNDTSVEVATKQFIQDKYYYNQLNDYSKSMYDTLLNSLDTFKSGSGTIQFTIEDEIGEGDFQAAWDALKLDHPEIFYVDTKQVSLITEQTSYFFGKITKFKYYIKAKSGGFYLSSFTNSQEVEDADKAIASVSSSIVQGATGNRYDKIKYVHDWLVDHDDFDTSSDVDQDTIYGALVKKKAVCEGYSNSFKYLMDKLDIPCVTVYGTGKNSDGNEEAHAWNYVQMEDSKWYAIDCTWDDPIITGGGKLNNENKYKYFLVGSDVLFENHKEDGDVSGTNQNFKYPKLNTSSYTK